MDKIIIEKHNFEIAKGKILNASNRVPSYISLNQFPTEGSIFSWNDHNITGSEANSLLVTPLQKTLISQNNSIKEVLNIVDEIYQAFDSLDKEYIEGIVGAVKAAQAASNQAKTASVQALNASSEALTASKKAQDAQTDIKRTIEALQKTVNILKEFKEKVSKDYVTSSMFHNQLSIFKDDIQRINRDDEQTKKCLKSFDEKIKAINGKISSISKFSILLQSLSDLKHVKDIDTLWNDVEKHKTNLAGFHEQVDNFMTKMNQASERVNNDIVALQNYRSSLEAYHHLSDVDSMWNDIESHKENLASFHEQIDNFMVKVNQESERVNNDIVALQNYRSSLEAYQHLSDVDSMWNDIESHKANLAGFHEQVDNFMVKVNQESERFNNDIAALQGYRSSLEAYQHLSDVDSMWNDIENHKANLTGINEQVNNFIAEVHSTHRALRESISKLEESNELTLIKYKKRTKIAYCIGGCALGLSIINYIFQIIGIL